MVVYLDIIWLLNVLVDSLLLWITAIFLKRHVKLWRLLLGGIAGSIVILLSVTPVAEMSGHPLAKFGLSVFMVMIAFGYKRFKTFISSLLTFYFATFLMGGTLIGVHYFLSFDMDLETAYFLESIKGFGDPISWLFVIFAFPLAWYFSRKRVDDMTISSVEYSVLADVSIHLNGLHIHVKGLIDSGNQLYDPISKTPVMIISILSLKEVLPEEIVNLSNESNHSLEAASELPDQWREKMRLIPAKTLGMNHQLLFAFKPESIKIKLNDQEKVARKALIAFTDQHLSSDGKFECIVHPLIIEQAISESAS